MPSDYSDFPFNSNIQPTPPTPTGGPTGSGGFGQFLQGAGSALPFIGPLVSGFTQLMNSKRANRQSQENYNTTFRDQRFMADQAWNRDLEMWHMNNKYNDPKQQMARLREAGLNPHLVYGSGQVAGNTSGTMPKYQAVRPEAKVVPSQLPDTLHQYIDLKHKNNQADLVKEQQNLTESKKATEIIIQGLLGKKATGESLQNQIRSNQALYSGDMQKALVDKTVNSASLTGQQFDTEKNKTKIADYEKQIKKVERDLIREGITLSDSPELRTSMLFLLKMGVTQEGIKNY